MKCRCIGQRGRLSEGTLNGPMVEDHLAKLRLTSPVTTLFTRPATQDQTNVHLAYQQLLLSQSSKNRFQSITNLMIALVLALLPFAAYIFSGMGTESLGPFRYIFRDGISYLWTPRPAQRVMYIYNFDNRDDDGEVDEPRRPPATLKQIEIAVSSVHSFNLVPLPYPSAIPDNNTQQAKVQFQMQPSPWEAGAKLWDGPNTKDARKGSGLQSCTEAQLELLSEALRRRSGTRAPNKDAFLEQRNKQDFVNPSGQWIVDEVLEATSSRLVFVLRES